MPDFDLAIIGSGSGNTIVGDAFAGKRVAIVEEGVFGGTCLNVGCIPTKMYVYTAEVASTVSQAGRYGLDATLDGVRWVDVRDRIFDRIDPISRAGAKFRSEADNTTRFSGHAEFIGERAVRVSSDSGAPAEFTASRIVVAAGARPVVPEVIRDSNVPFHTSDTILRIDHLPSRLLVLGGGYVAAELASVFAALGCRVTVVARGSTLLARQDADISGAFTEHARRRWDLRLDSEVSAARSQDGVTTLVLADGAEVSADALLVATGRAPNSDRLALDKAGVRVREDGRIEVDCYGRTTAPGVWALGDVSSPYQLKHVANHEAEVVAHNLCHPEALRSFDHRHVPSAVFTEPQIASVGLTEQQAIERGVDYVTAIQRYGENAYGWAMEDDEGFCKVIADRTSKLLLGAHIMGAQASMLIQPLIQAISFGQQVDDVAGGQYWIHPALTEVVENALLQLDFG